MKTNELLLNVLVSMVESVTSKPRRVLFMGMSDLGEAFRKRVQKRGWTVSITGEGGDVVGERNNAAIDTLVVFYRDEVRERESLNAFKEFTEGDLVEALIRRAIEGELKEPYTSSDADRLRFLVGQVYPSAHQLADFLLEGKGHVGHALPLLGLFADPDLHYGLHMRQWQVRIDENRKTAVLRWREFLDTAQRRRDARDQLGKGRVALLQRAESDPSVKQQVLEQVVLSDALMVLNPPKRLVEKLMRDGMPREAAERLVSDVKSGRVDPSHLPASLAFLSEASRRELLRIPKGPVDEDNGSATDEDERRVGFCLEGLLGLAGAQTPLPHRLCIARTDSENGDRATVMVRTDGTLSVEVSADAARALSVPLAQASELSFRVYDPAAPDKALWHFSLDNLTRRLEPYAEIWPGDEFWRSASALDAKTGTVWHRLEQSVRSLREVVDPDWRRDGAEVDEAEGEEEKDNREPNNPIYVIFDIVYLANRSLFEAFLDAWLEAATLPWRCTVTAKPDDWQKAVDGLLRLGLAQRSDGSYAVLPFHPVRLVWYREVFRKIEGWLTSAITKRERLIFEPRVLAEQLRPADRPRALLIDGKRLLEAFSAFQFSIFVPEERQHRTRAPLERARQKIQQFGRMWPFSLDRLHLAFQPSDADEDVYELVEAEAAEASDAAFRVRAIVQSTGVSTCFDQYLLTTGDNTTDLLTQEYHESISPRVEFAKGLLGPDEADGEKVVAHTALLVDAFREESYGVASIVGSLNINPHWKEFRDLAGSADTAASREQLKRVCLTAPAFHTGLIHGGQRDIVYAPMDGSRPELMRLLVDSLLAWSTQGLGTEGAYYERVRWDAESLKSLHDRADWVLLFDRTIEKALFKELEPKKIKLIDFYSGLRGGYRLSVSSRRTDAVQWQLAQVLQQFFGDSGLDLQHVAGQMLDTLAGFASGLLLKTLGGGSLAQELLGLYATYLSLMRDGEFNPQCDWLIPLDDYQGWFGRRTQIGRRADLLVLRCLDATQLEMLAVESKWYTQHVSREFVVKEFGKDGQLRSAVSTLHSLFDPAQQRLDRDYWQRMLASLLDGAPPAWDTFRQLFHDVPWSLSVDGMVYVHQYSETDSQRLRQRAGELNDLVREQVGVQRQSPSLFARGQDYKRLRLQSFPELVALFKGG